MKAIQFRYDQKKWQKIKDALKLKTNQDVLEYLANRELNRIKTREIAKRFKPKQINLD